MMNYNNSNKLKIKIIMINKLMIKLNKKIN